MSFIHDFDELPKVPVEPIVEEEEDEEDDDEFEDEDDEDEDEVVDAI